jgi:hypothetical protein
MVKVEYLTPDKAAEYLKSQGLPCSKSSLQAYRRHGGGPCCLRFGPRSVVYTKAALDDWKAARLREVTP